MKKHLSLLMLAAALLLPWALKAQTTDATVPYSTGFETDDDPDWELINGSVTNKWCIGTAVHNSGSRALYVSANNGTSNDYTVSASGCCFAVRTFTFSDAGQYGISFDWKSGGESTYDYLRCFLVPNDVTLTAGTTLPTGLSATGTPTGWIDLGGKMNLSGGSWMQTVATFFITTPGTYKIVFVWRNDISGGTQPAAAVDNVYVAEISCPQPLLTLANLASDEAEISWDYQASASEYLYSVDGALWQSTTNNSITLTGLTPQSAHSVSVRSYCGGTDTSFISTISFTTPCAAVATTALPWTYGFEDATGTSATSTFNACLGRYRDGTTTNYPYPSATHHGDGTKSLYMYSTASVHSWLTLPAFEEDLSNLYLSFWVYRAATSTYGHWAVGVMSNPEDITTFDTLASGQASNAWELIEVPLDSYTGNGQFIAILCPKGTGTNYTYIDDITVGYPPACPTPGAFAVSNVTSTTVDLSWSSSASEFIVEYGPNGFTPGTGDSLIAYSNSITLEYLQMGMTYTACITAICGTDTSNTLRGTFTTGCAGLTADDLPYTETFEAYGTGTGNPINACWTKGTNSTTTYPYPYATNAINGQRSLYFYSTHASSATGASYYCWAAMPPIDESLDMNTLQVEFMARRYATTTAAYHSMVLVGVADSISASTTNVELDTMVTWIDTVDLTSQAASSIHSVEVSFENYTGNGRYVVFYAPIQNFVSGTMQYNYIYLDDITLMLIPSCYRPTEARADEVLSDEVTLSWTPDDRTLSPAGWSVEYGPEGFTTGEGLTETSTDTTITITDLTPNTLYEFRISADCGTLSDPRTITLRTRCADIATEDLPYTEDFESYTSGATNPISTCWTKGTNNTTAYPYPYSTNAIGGNLSLYFYSYYPSSATAARIYSYAALPAFEASVNQLGISFQARRYGTTTAYYNSFIVVGVMTDPNDISTFDTVEIVDLTAEAALSIHDIYVSLEDYAGEGRYIALYSPVPQLTGTNNYAYNYIYIDNVAVDILPSCERPQGIAITTCTDVEATLVITDTNHVDNYIITLTAVGGTTDTTITTTAEIYTFTGLDENTNYHVEVVTDCDDGTHTAALVLDFRTTCAPVADTALPYVEDFESYTSGSANPISPCWTKAVFGTTTQYPYPYSTAGINSGMGLYGYGSSSIYSYAALPLFETPLNELSVSFYMRRYSTQTYQTRVLVGVMGNPNDLTTFDTIEDIDITDEPTSSIHHFNVSLAGYTGTGNIAFYIPKASNGASTNAVHLDSVVVDLLPSCVWPSSVAVDSVEAHSVTLTWNGTASNYYVEYSPHSNFDSIAGTTTVATNSATVTGLNSYKTYYFRVRSICGNDSSIWSLPASVQTPVDCGAGSINIVDTIGDGTSTSSTYTFYSSTSYRTGVSSAIYTAQELYEMGLQTNNRLNGIKLHSGSTGGTIRKAKIYVKEVSLNGYTSAADSVNRNTMTLVYSGDLVVPASSWVEIPFDSPFVYNGTGNLLISLYHDSTCSAAVTFYYTSTTPDYLNFYGYRSTATAANNTFNRTYYRPNTLFNFCTEIPACVRPSDLTASATDTLVTLGWTGDAATYDVVLSTSSINPDSATGITSLTTDDTTATIGGLTPTTTYYYYVRANCGGISGSSEWSLEGSFTTACEAKILPYSEDFESYTSGSSYPIDPCWNKGSNSSTAYPYPYSTNAVSGNRSLYFYAYRSSSTTYYSYAALPLMEDSVKNLSLSMNVRRYGTVTDAYTSRLVIGVMTDPTDIATFFPMDTLDLKYEPALSIHGYEFFFNEYTGDGKYIAIYNEVPPLYGTGTTCYSYAYVDDVVVDRIPACPRPRNIALDSVAETTATIHWTSAGTSFEIEYGPHGFFRGNGTTVTSTTNSYDLTGLTQGLTYDVYIRAFCSATDTSDWSFAFNFTTDCGINPLPYTEDFETYSSGASVAIDPCWVKGSNSTTAYPYPYSTNAVTGNRSLYFYAYRPSSGTEYYSYAALPLMADSVKNLKLSFNVRRYATVSNTYTTRLLIGVMTNPADINTFFPMDTLDLQQAAGSSVHGYEFCFNNYTGNGQHIAIYDAVPPFYGTGTSCYSYAYVDDIVVDYIPSCLRPTNVTVTGVTYNAATVHWTGNAASYEVEYGPQGFAPGMGTTLTVTADSIALTGLQNSTVYDIYVRGICSATDNSDWSFVTTFATECGPNALPMLFDPNNYATGTGTPLPICWTRTNNVTGTYDYYPYINSSSANAHTGTNVLYYYFYNSASYPNDELMAFPEVDTVNFPMNTVEVSFWAKSSVTGKHLIVGVMTDPTNLSTFQTVDTISLTTTVSEYFVDFSNFTGHGAYVALRGVMEGTSSYYTYVDDIVIATISHCPRNYNLTAYDGTATGATLAWTDTIGSSQWVIEYGLLNDSVTSTVTVNSNPYTLTGLTANNYYFYRVAPICSDGIQASMSTESCYFTTSQVPATMPYSYDFEAAAEWANWQTSSNNAVNWYRGDSIAGNNTNAMYLSADNGATHSWNMSAVTNVVAYRDIDFGADTHSYQISFDAYVGGTVGHNFDGVSIVVADPAMPVTSVSTGITSPWGHVNTVGLGTVRHDTLWGQHTIYLDGMTGVRRVVFYHFNQATGTNYPYEDNPPAIDNISIIMQPCERPGMMTSNVIDPYTAILSWVGDPAAQYEVCYRVKGAPVSTNIYQTVTGTSATVTGLLPASDYNWWVRKICTMTATDTLVSSFAGSRAFTTPCVALSVADTLREGFEGIAADGTQYNATAGLLPNCWDSWSSGGATVYPHINNDGSYSYWVEGSASITLTSAGSSTSYGSNSYVALPEIAEPTNALTLAFWYCTEGSSASYGELAVGYLTGTNYDSDFVPVRTYSPSSQSAHSGNGLQTAQGIRDTVTFDSVPDGNFRLAFRWYKESTFYSCCIDDVAVWADNTCPAPTVATQTHTYETATITVNGTNDNYELAYGTDPSTLGDTLTSTTGTFAIAGLTPATQYFYAVRQLCDSGEVSNWTTGLFMTDSLPCLPVTGLDVVATGYETVTLTWTATGIETAWEVMVYNTVDTFTYNTTATTFEATGLTSGVFYYADVRPLCGSNHNIEGDWTGAPVSFTTDICQPVTGVTITDTTTNTATVTWTAPAAGSGSYRLEYGFAGFSQGQGTDATATTNSYTITGLEEQTMYDVYVANICTETLTSTWSTKVTFETPAAGGSGEGIVNVDADGNLTLYPNPATTTVTLTVSELFADAELTIVDLNGRIVLTSNLRHQTSDLDISTLAPGAYFVRLTGDKATTVRKLIVK